MKRLTSSSLSWILLAILAIGCSRDDAHTSGKDAEQYQETALAFTKALAARDYPAAYALTGREYQNGTSLQAMQEAFERVVPRDWKTVGPVQVGETMSDWPGKTSVEVGWVYLTIGGDAYSEGVTVTVGRAVDGLRVRTVTFGRP